ncbi:hypothetical protein GGC64_004727 [Mycobacterium sp. OAS707]|uniref:hypothetical protein n=1 Tax=Mycobacterium sp. OAS707 TaxID=2663822 RepID=UPI0017898CF8|nr:hypothetical protein [Mycobacterium sp. OAS707]
MKILPASIEQQINRVDRQPSLFIGIACGLVAFWSIYRVIWSLYLAMTYDFLFGSLVFGIVFWGVVGAIAAVAAFGFITRYTKAPTGESNESPKQ